MWVGHIFIIMNTPAKFHMNEMMWMDLSLNRPVHRVFNVLVFVCKVLWTVSNVEWGYLT